MTADQAARFWLVAAAACLIAAAFVVGFVTGAAWVYWALV